MGYIYKIENKITHNIYIGQTVQTMNKRWRDHVFSAVNIKNKDHNCPLHLAILKYGEENFEKTIIEECSAEELNQREIFWINYYNSYNNGYNASLGGEGHQKYNYEAIKDYYLSHDYSIVETCKHFQIYDQVVYTALRNYDINYKDLKTATQKKWNKRILLIENKIVFNKISDAEKYLNIDHAGANIRRCLNGITQKAYGDHWKEIEDDINLDNFGYTLFTPGSISI